MRGQQQTSGHRKHVERRCLAAELPHNVPTGRVPHGDPLRVPQGQAIPALVDTHGRLCDGEDDTDVQPRRVQSGAGCHRRGQSGAGRPALPVDAALDSEQREAEASDARR